MTGMAGYTKLFNSILASSVWQTSLEVKVLWITLLAMADKDGLANASIPGLAKIAGLSIEATEEGLEELLSPDKYSRTKSNEGRRIEVADGGWKLLNHAKYRAQMSIDERREYKKLKQRQYRLEARGIDVDNPSTGGLGGHNAEADTKADAEAKAEEQKRKTDSYKPTCPSCGVVGSLQRTPERNGYPAGWWCRNVKSKTLKGGGCGENFPLATPEIVSGLSPVARREIDKAVKPEYVSPGMILTSQLKYDEKGMLIE